MAVQFSANVRNTRLDSIETEISTAPKLYLYSGTAPATTATAASGTLIVSITLPSDWMAAASAGAKAKSGTWQATAGASATAGHFRIYNAANTVCHIQGTCTNTGDGGDMTLDNVVINSGQQVTINTFTLTDGNA